MKKLVFLMAAFSLAFSQYLGGIAVIVNNQPITDYEIDEMMAKNNLSKEKAINLLIRNRLEDAQIAALDISANDFEINNKIDELAAANRMDRASFESLLRARGVSHAELFKDMAKNIKKEKLYARFMGAQSQNITPENALKFYENNSRLFAQFEEIKLTQYIASSQEALAGVVKSPFAMHHGVQSKNLTLHASKIDPQLNYVLKNTSTGTFTPIFNTAQNRFETFYVADKRGQFVPEFKAVESQVIAQMSADEREIAVEDYFNKLRSKAIIEYIKR